VGTLEAHGKHLPLGTDSFLAQGIAERIADSTGAILAPTLQYGITNSLLPYPGGTQVDPETYSDFIAGILEGLFEAGFNKIIIANGHGGNTQPLQKLVRDMTPLYPDKFLLVFDWYMMDSDIVADVYNGTSGHAGLDETAGVIYFRPELVREDLYDEDDYYVRQDGYVVSPSPAPIILEDENSLPRFDPDKAKTFFEKVLDRLISRISRDISLWEANFGRGAED
jgi:creatinine amidohydrolase